MNAFCAAPARPGASGHDRQRRNERGDAAGARAHKRVYFAAIGGAGAQYAQSIKRAELVAFPDLLSEAIYRMEVEDFPAVVAIDSAGNSVYDR